MRAGEWIRIPGTAEWTRREGDFCTLYARPTKGAAAKARGNFQWAIYQQGTLLLAGYAESEQGAKRDALDATGPIEFTIRETIRALSMHRKPRPIDPLAAIKAVETIAEILYPGEGAEEFNPHHAINAIARALEFLRPRKEG